MVVLNLSDKNQMSYSVQFDGQVTLQECINSDGQNYGGTGITNDWILYTDANNRISLRIASFSGAIFRVMDTI